MLDKEEARTKLRQTEDLIEEIQDKITKAEGDLAELETTDPLEYSAITKELALLQGEYDILLSEADHLYTLIETEEEAPLQEARTTY